MNLIPTTDLAEYLLLPREVRDEVAMWLQALEGVSRPIQKSLERIAAQLGGSSKTARRKYDAWRVNRDWRVLINRSKVPQERGLDPAFIDYWKKLCEQNGRKCKPAYRELVRRFKAGEPIPGLPPGISRKSLPPGCTYSNLSNHKPTKFELSASRIGRGASADLRPKIFTTRRDLRVGMRYIFDDLWHDFKVVMERQRRAMRLLQLHAHDLFSGCQFARGLKPRVEDPETGKSVNLHEDEMLFLVAHVLSEFGYCGDGCVLMVEHGTAAVAEALEQLLFDLTSGKVTVDRSGIEGIGSFAGQYAGRSKGNFRFKAALESLGNLIHNETANLLQFPGQTGSNSRVNAPEELHGRDRHADALLKAMAALPAARVEHLRLPFLEVNAAKWLVEEIMERINQRTDHELEGWLEAGLTTTDFDVPGVGTLPSSAVLALPEDRRMAVCAVATPVARRLSPREVFDAGRRELVKLRPEQTAALLLKGSAGQREVIVGDDHLITFEDGKVSPAPMRYLAHHFAPGDKFLTVVNPWSLDKLHLFDARQRWVGVVSAWQTISQVDTDALHQAMGRAAKVERELLAPVAARGAEITRKRLEDAQHNAGVLGQTTEEKKHQQQVRKFDGDVAELAETPAPEEESVQDDFSADALL